MKNYSMRCADCGASLAGGEVACPACGTQTGELLRPEVEIPGYAIQGLLGEGGIGRVYLARDRKLGRRVAIKIISEKHDADDETSLRFQREARTMAAVEHERIVRVHTFGETNGRLYLVMQYVEGEDLARRIRREGVLAAGQALQILRQCVEALAEAWAVNIVHRDVKPSNILLDGEGRALLADFGLARSCRLDETTLTRTGHLVGTPYYISPEQARGEREIDWRSDIYSLGVVFYEMLTGHRPFEGPSPFAVVDQHLHAPLPPLEEQRPGADPGLGRLIEWMTRKDPADRPASHDELLQQLDVLLAGGTVSIPNPRPGFAGGPFAPSALSGSVGAPGETGSAGEVAAPVFCGREQELAQLDGFLGKALSGTATVAFVTGEAGTGKTALVNEFVRRALADHASLVAVTGNCNAYTGLGDPYLPFREALGLLTGDIEARWAAGAISGSQARRLWHLLPRAARALVETGPGLVGNFVPGPALLTRIQASGPDGEPWSHRLRELVETPFPAPLQQNELYEQYEGVLRSLAAEQPLLLLLEDLHWADAGSLSLLFHLGRRLGGTRLLLVGTYRPEEVAQGRGTEQHPLEPVLAELKREHGEHDVALSQTGDRRFVDEFLDSEPNRLGETFRETFFRQTEGHPLFTVELLREMEAQGALVRDEEGRWIEDPSLEWGQLPVRVEAAIGARVERLPETLRSVLLTASVEGEEFTAEVVARLQKMENQQMVRLLSGELGRRRRLVSVQGVQQVEGRRLSRYRFSHVLFQRYLYTSLDRAERAYIHQDVGTVLEALHGARMDEIAVQLAYHFEEAELAAKAVPYLLQAGNRALRLSAHQEAVTLFRRGLALLETLPESDERNQKELAFQLGVAIPLQATRGYATPEVFDACTRARELCGEVGDSPELFQALMILMVFYTMRAEYQPLLELDGPLEALARRLGDPDLIALANWAPGLCLLSKGEYSTAYDRLERIVAHYDPEKHHHFAFLYSFDPGVACLQWTGYSLWYLGFPDQARERCERAISLARELEDAHSIVSSLIVSGGFINLLRREYENAGKYLEAAMPLVQKQGFEYYLTLGQIQRGIIQTRCGRPEEGLVLLDQALTGMKLTGARNQVSAVLSLKAGACLAAGRVEEGLAAVSLGLAQVEECDERIAEAELLRLKGELLLARGDGEAAAETCYLEALEVARGRQGRIQELRAAVSLARLRAGQGRREEARELLAGIYGWFTEGFDIPDLVEARRLLDELSGN